MEEMMINRLRLIIKQIQDFTSSALNYCSEIDNLSNAEVIFKKLETAINRFTTELHNYFNRSTESSADEISSFSEIQLKGEEVLSELAIKIKTVKEATVVTQTERKNVLTGKLPKLNLPEFGGDILEFHQFWDQFDSNIGSRNLADVDKLLYLKSSLRGDAKKTIEGLETTNKNYDIAVSTLKNRYGRESHIIDAHYAALYRVKAPAGKNITEIRDTLNEIERHLRVLKSLGENINHNHLRFLILEKMPSDIVYELKLKVDTESIEEIRRQLEIIISAREDANRITTNNRKEEYTTQTLQINANNKRWKHRKVNQNYKRDRKGLVLSATEGKGRVKREENDKTYKDGFRNQLKRKQEEQYKRREFPERKRRKLPCIFCQGEHFNDQCDKFKTIQERKGQLKGRCYGCLSKDHSVGACKREIYCTHCKERGMHNRALCPRVSTSKIENTNTLHSKTISSTVLQTAIVKARRENDNSIGTQCRVLLDSGSQRTYITQEVAKKLNLPVEEESRLSVFTFGSKTPQEIESDLVKLEIETRTNATLVIFANVVPYISQDIPYTDLDIEKWKNDAVLADDGSMSSKIDILIGNDYYFSLILDDKIQLDDNLFLIESKLGWILTGKSNIRKVNDDLTAITYFQAVENKLTPPDLPLDNGNLKCLWELESIGICDSPKVTREEETIKQFNDTIDLIDNRYTVCWPWIEYPPNLPSNFGLAFGRLVNLLKRIDSETLSSYDKTLKEQMEKGIIELVPDVELEPAEMEHPIHYLPHHGVSQPGKPIRIVYDASAKTKDNKSLNECLHCGPLMLEDLTGMFLRFRSHKIGITADVEKAFLQIALRQKDRDVTRFLWLKDVTKPATKDNLSHLRFCRVPFGIISSPFLLNATLKHHLLSLDEDILKRVVNDIYVDNLVSGTNSIEEAKSMYKTCKKAFQDISMNLREWTSNSQPFIESIPAIDVSKDSDVKVLGLKWCTKEDTIRLQSKKTADAKTKRDVLRNIASIYDPCGYTVPDLLPAKLFLQKLWKGKYKWDTPLTDDLASEWQDIAEQLQETQDIILPRRYFKSKDTDVQLHIFTDASTKAYAAAAYVTNGKEISFVIGKSRLVPIKDQENLKIPRLELLGVLIGSRLLKYITKYLQYNFTQLTIWTDSQIVIDWYYSHKLLPPFFSRRIEEIKKNASVVIRYVPSELNPTDVATRPTNSRDQKKSWLSGPKFLLDDSKTWPTSRRSELSLFSGEGLPNEEEGLSNEEEVLPEGEFVVNNVRQNITDKQETAIKETFLKLHVSHYLTYKRLKEYKQSFFLKRYKARKQV